MGGRFIRKASLSRGERAVIMAYAAMMAVAAGMTIMIMSSLAGNSALPPEPTLVDNWAVIAGGLAGGAALFLLRGWMGKAGFLGMLRAVAGSLMIAFVASFVAGTLIAPLAGTVMGPLLLLAVFLSQPLLVVTWCGVGIIAHLLLIVRRQDLMSRDDRAISQLSQLSQLNLYRRKIDN